MICCMFYAAHYPDPDIVLTLAEVVGQPSPNEPFESYKYLVSNAISAMEEMTKHAESVDLDSLSETWAPYISQCDSIYRQIFGRQLK